MDDIFKAHQFDEIRLVLIIECHFSLGISLFVMVSQVRGIYLIVMSSQDRYHCGIWYMFFSVSTR